MEEMGSMNEHEHERLVSLIVSFNERTNEHAARADRAKRAKRAPPPATTMKRRGTKWCVRGGYLENRERALPIEMSWDDWPTN